MLATLALMLLGQCDPLGPIYSCPSSGVSYAFFEFAPASGAGMGAACACTTPTGAKGEALTFSRASTGWCTKGNETTGIANGDLVECASGQPRVMPGNDGTGGLGLSVWEARTNTVLRSAELDNAAWSAGNSGAGAPTVTANYATAPDGTTTAERIQVPATAVGQFSSWRQPSVCPISTFSGSVYVRGTSGSGSVDLALDDGTNYFHAVTAFTNTSWTRVRREGIPPAALGGLYVGNLGQPDGSTSTTLGASARTAIDILVWGAQCEIGVARGPYIATTAAAATRVAEKATFPFVRPTPASGSMSVAVVRGAAASTSDSAHLEESLAGAFKQMLYVNSPTQMQFYVGALSNGTLTAASSTGDVTYAGWWDTTNQFLIQNGAQTAGGGAPTTSTSDILSIGTRSAVPSAATNGVLKKVCADPSPLRCR